MTARIKSRVLRREEKALGTFDFQRLMFAGMGTGIVWAISRAMNMGALSLVLLIVSFIFFIWISGNRAGTPRYRAIFLSWQGEVLVNARRNPSGLSAQMVKTLNWDDSTLLNGADLFSEAGIVVDVQLEGLEILDTDDLNAGGFEIIPDDVIIIELN